MNDLSTPSKDRADAMPSRTGRVTFVLPGLRAGGSEHVVTFVADRLVERGHTVEIVSFETGEMPPYYTPRPEVRLVYLSRPVKRRSKLSALREIAARTADLRRHLKRSRPDLVVSFLTRTNVQTVLAATGTGIPVIVSERNNPVLQDPGPVWRRLRARTYRQAHGLITMTRGAMDCFDPGMRRRGWVIPNMAEWGEQRALGSDGERKRLTAVGRLTHQKGFDLLLKAFAAIADDHPDWDLCIWGEGPDRQALESLRDTLGLSGRAQLPGVTDRPGGWIEKADAFVLSSRFEGWGLVLGEAMAAGLPCVSFACDFGPSEMIEDGVDGLLAKDGDIASLSDRLDELMSDGALRARIGTRARQSSQRYRPERIGRLWTDLVEGVLEEVATTAQTDGKP
ncbi:glycosyltransferase family 4 protein [Erythrobacter sp.]|uniref:glycosyltransferase family 4 protein n=1 Tax=Erythrobacter sp. TaxID=1042 RepID=UPI003C796F32